MTTIAADARTGTIGSDSFCSAGYHVNKLVSTKRGIFGMAGDDRAIARFEAYLRGGKKPAQIPDGSGEEFCALQLHEGKLWIWGEAMRPELLLTPYHAIGTGGPYAAAALRHGASVLEALETAEYYDSNTKGPMFTVRERDEQ